MSRSTVNNVNGPHDGHRLQLAIKHEHNPASASVSVSVSVDRDFRSWVLSPTLINTPAWPPVF